MFSITASAASTTVVARRSAVTATRRPQSASRAVLVRADAKADEGMKATGETTEAEQAMKMSTEKTASAQGYVRERSRIASRDDDDVAIGVD
jgi:hypothetical protein